jgi:hypothetical protein
MRIPEIELLWWEGCPSTDRAQSELREALRETGLEAAEISMRQIETDEAALATGFRGSDLAGARALDQPIGLSCRVYTRRDGTISPTPDPEDLRAALRRATTQAEVSR